MNVLLRRALVLGLLVVAWPALGADAPKDAGDKPDAKDQSAEKVIPLGQVGGVIKNTGGSQKVLTLEVTQQLLEVNPGAEAHVAREQEDLLRRQREILKTRNPVARQREMLGLMREIQRMQATQQNLFRIKEVKKDVEVAPDDDVKVRSLQPPVVYDDKGYPKKYTPEELKGLRGDGKLPGYASDLDSVQPGQVVIAYLARKKPGAAKEAEKESQKDLDTKDLAAGERPLATMLVIVAEPKGK
jgi:hypothetical protein